MRRIPELDSVRGLAAIIILLYHLAPATFHNGWSAVDCFFVLSSYLITSILLEYRDAPGFFKNFYARRSLRIWPIYYLCLLTLVVANSVLHINESVAGLPYYLTYTQNIQLYWGEQPPDFIRAFSHSWTLALEEQYYILWPLVVYFCSSRWLIAISLAAAVGSSLANYYGVSGVILAGRCNGFALGGLLAVLFFRRDADPEFRSKWSPLFAAIMIGATVLTTLSITGHLDIHRQIAFTICFFGLIGFVILESGKRWLAPFRLPALMYVGTISYGLYLYHIPIDRGFEILMRKIGVRHRLDVGYPVWRTALEMAIVFVVAVLSWHFIEKPLLKLKSRFEYRSGRGKISTANPQIYDAQPAIAADNAPKNSP